MTPADDVVRAAADQVGLDGQGVELLREGSNALFRMRDGVIARVGKPGSGQGAQREIEVARWLIGEGVLVVRPAAGVAQPVVIDDRPVTWWEELPPHRSATPAELGAALRELHHTTPPTRFQLAALDPFAGFSTRIADAELLTAAERDWLADRLEYLRSGWRTMPSGLPHGVIHGDAWQGNVAVTPDGSTVLLDLEHVALGPPEWDLVHVAADYTDFARISEAEYRSFVDAYGGYDATVWPGFRTMADVVELRWVCFALGRSAHSTTAAAEAHHRIACLRGDVPRPWTWHAL